MAFDGGVFVEPVGHEFVDGEEMVDVPVRAGSHVALPFQAHPQVEVVGDGGDAFLAQPGQDEFDAGCVPAVGMDPHEHVRVQGFGEDVVDGGLRFLQADDMVAQRFE